VLARQVDRLSSRFDANASFEVTAREFHATKKVGWSDHYAKRWMERLEKDIFPWLGKLPLSQIGAPMLLQTLRRVEARGTRELPHSLLEACGQVFRYGVATGRCERSPASDLRGALKPVLTRHVSAIVEPDQVGDLMRAIDGYHGHPVTRAALLLSALLFQRPGNIRQMEWAELDLEARMWAIPSAKMKRTKREKINGRPHLVPLATQAVDALKDLMPLTGRGRYVFPSLISAKRPMSENTVRVALRRLGFDNETMTPHGFRAMARTVMVERLNVAPDVIEAQLAHGKSGPLGAAYDRAEFIEQRREMMKAWADYLDELKTKPLGRPREKDRTADGTHRTEGCAPPHSWDGNFDGRHRSQLLAGQGSPAAHEATIAAAGSAHPRSGPAGLTTFASAGPSLRRQRPRRTPWHPQLLAWRRA
jgi:integrase